MDSHLSGRAWVWGGCVGVCVCVRGWSVCVRVCVSAVCVWVWGECVCACVCERCMCMGVGGVKYLVFCLIEMLTGRTKSTRYILQHRANNRHINERKMLYNRVTNVLVATIIHVYTYNY